MIVITLEPNTLEYLKFIFESHCEKGLPVAELNVAAATWNSIFQAREVTKEGVTPVFHQEYDEAPAQEQTTKHIQGPLNIEVNGDMTVPISPEQHAKMMAEDMFRIP